MTKNITIFVQTNFMCFGYIHLEIFNAGTTNMFDIVLWNVIPFGMAFIQLEFPLW